MTEYERIWKAFLRTTGNKLRQTYARHYLRYLLAPAGLTEPSEGTSAQAQLPPSTKQVTPALDPPQRPEGMSYIHAFQVRQQLHALKDQG